MANLDEVFNTCLLEIDVQKQRFRKHEKIRIDSWIKKLKQVTTNPVWKRNRNVYADLLLEMIYNNNLEEPFSHIPPEGPIQKLNRANIRPLHKKKGTWSPPSKSTSARRIVSKSNLDRENSVAKVNRTFNSKVNMSGINTSVSSSALASQENEEISRLKNQLRSSQANERKLRQELMSQQKVIQDQQKLIDELSCPSAQKSYRSFKSKNEEEVTGNYLQDLDAMQKETAKLTQVTQERLKKPKPSHTTRKKQMLNISPEVNSVNPFSSPMQEFEHHDEFEMSYEDHDDEMMRLEGSIKPYHGFKATDDDLDQSLDYSQQSYSEDEDEDYEEF